jgi:hypothetical protein
MAGIAFQASKMTKSCISEALYISTKSLMTLEELITRPNIGFVNARYLWVEGHTTFEGSQYQGAKMPTEALLILWVEGIMPLEESFSQQNK